MTVERFPHGVCSHWMIGLGTACQDVTMDEDGQRMATSRRSMWRSTAAAGTFLSDGPHSS